MPIPALPLTIPALPPVVTPALDAALTRTLDSLTTRGYLAADITLSGVQVQAAQRVAGKWSVGGWASRTWQGQQEAGLRVKGTW